MQIMKRNELGGIDKETYIKNESVCLTRGWCSLNGSYYEFPLYPSRRTQLVSSRQQL
jgi:hypothetical protein